MKTVTLKRDQHRGENIIRLEFSYDKKLIDIAKSLGAKWSQSKSVWYVKNNPENLKSIFSHFTGKAWVDKTAIFREDYPQNNTKMQTTTRNYHIKTDVRPEVKKLLTRMERHMKQANYSTNTINTYKHMVSLFFSWYKERKVEEISKQDITNFNHDFILIQGYSFSFQNQLINALKYFYKNCTEQPIQLDEIERPRKVQKLPQVLSKEEVKAVLESCSNIKHRTALSLIYGCGLRRSELLNLKVSDIDYQRKVLWIRQSKGAKDRFVPLGQKLLHQIDEYRAAWHPKAFLFEGQKGGAYSPSSLREAFKKALKKAGVTKDVSLHDLRHSYATHLHEAGTDILYIQHLLGHKSSKTTEIYTHISKQNLQNVKSPFDDI